MKILITGANGLLGQKLVALYGEHPEYEVVATGRGFKRFKHLPDNVQYRQLDVAVKQQVLDVMDQERPEAIIHTAAMTNVDECEENQAGCMQLNVKSVEYLISACQMHNIYLCHLSTDFIFDGESGPYKEDDEPNPLSVYGRSKLKSEQVLLSSEIEYCILRTVLVYGVTPGMSRSNIILWVKNALENGKALQLVNDQLRSPTLAEDLAMGCFLAIQNKAKGVYNIAGKDLLTPYDMAIATAEYFNLDSSLINKTDSTQFTQKAKRPLKTGLNITKAQKELAYAPRSFKEGIEIVASLINEE